MSKQPHPISELDLLAYADGLLEADVVRKAAVRRHLETHPDAAAYVADVEAQNEEIRRLYGPRLVEPVPERLLDVLESRSSRDGGRGLTAAVAALLLLAATGGWLLGQHENGGSNLTAFADQAAAHHRSAADALSQASSAGDAAPSLSWLDERIAIKVAMPDLRAEGFRLVAKKPVGLNGDPAIHLTYHRPDGTEFNLFLRPRWEDRTNEVAQAEKNGVTVAYWLDGPLAFALTTNVRGAEADRLVAAVHEAIASGRLNDLPLSVALSQENGTPNPAVLNDVNLRPQTMPAASPAIEPEPR